MSGERAVIDAYHPHYGAHMTHCNDGENVGSCKYGEHDICPALSGSPSVHSNMTEPQLRRQAVNALFGPLVAGFIGETKFRAIVFRHKVGWLNEERHFVAAFAEERDARDFCSMQESQEYTWTVATIHPDEWTVRLGTICEFNGGLQVSRIIA